ncbi:T-cell immunomodulatory protein-like isoform X1 [Styela clava]
MAKYLIQTLVYVGLFLLVTATDDPAVIELDAKEFIGDQSQVGFTAAYGDVNMDKKTDVFVISNTRKEILIFLAYEKFPILRLNQTLVLDVIATSAVPADFNGDDITDLLITSKENENMYRVLIYWGGKDGKFSSKNFYECPERFYDEPLVLDANADTISDLFVVYSNHTTRGFLIGVTKQDKWSFVSKPFKTRDDIELLDPYSPHSNAFIDLTGEGSADLFLTSEKEGKIEYEIWNGSSSGLVQFKTISTYENDPNVKVSPVAFSDFNADGKQDILIAVCTLDADSCKDGKIVIYANDKWYNLFSTNEEWSFPNTKDELLHVHNTLHIADFNLDSYPDILMIMQNKEGIRKAVVFYNDMCKTTNCTGPGRQLGIWLEMPNSDNAVLSSFYDFNMDGTLDIIVTTKTNDDDKYTMKAYKNMIADDVTFLRVQVLSGHNDTAVYGVNVPGPYILYETTNTMGGAQCGSLGQMSQSSHLSLQLPYIIFGLGRLANFVDQLMVSVPVPLIIDPDDPVITLVDNNDDSDPAIKPNTSLSTEDPFTPRNYTWPMLIPNSQLYVNPYPRSSPNRWKIKVLVTPSQSVITTAIVLLGTCGVLVIATLVLHWFERREDKQEKIQESYGFHFDAM